MLDVKRDNGRIETGRNGVTSTFPTLTNPSIEVMNMAEQSLPTNFRTINLTQDQVAIVDADDYERVNQYKWTAQKVTTKGFGVRFYAYRTVWIDKKQAKILLHRFILDAPHGVQVDHKNRQSLDCRKSNLRLATSQQNSINRRRGNATTGFRGVSQHWRRFQAEIYHNNRQHHLGMFATAEAAAVAYDTAARQMHGEFAVLNFPDERENLDGSGACGSAEITVEG